MSDKEFQQHEEKQAQRRRDVDLEITNDARRGDFDTGRRTNRGLKDKHEREVLLKKERERHFNQAVKLSADYLKLHNAVMDSLGGAEAAVYDALVVASEELTAAEQQLSNIEDNAQTLPDGTKVFRAADGSVYTADGTKLDDNIAATIQWGDNAPSWEDHQAAKAARDRAKDRHKQLSKDNDRLTYIRGRMEDEDNPPTEDELEDFEKEIEDIHSRASPSANHEQDYKVEKPQQEPSNAIDFDF